MVEAGIVGGDAEVLLDVVGVGGVVKSPAFPCGGVGADNFGLYGGFPEFEGGVFVGADVVEVAEADEGVANEAAAFDLEGFQEGLDDPGFQNNVVVEVEDVGGGGLGEEELALFGDASAGEVFVNLYGMVVGLEEALDGLDFADVGDVAGVALVGDDDAEVGVGLGDQAGEGDG